MENALLIQYDGGWAERLDEASIAQFGRCEGYLALGAVTSLDEVYRLADAHLAEFSSPRVQTDVGIDPAGEEDTPYLGWHGVGDTVPFDEEDHQVLAMTVSESETGEAEFVPTLNAAVVLNAQERMKQAIDKMIPGTRGGRSKIAQAVVPVAPRRGRAPSPSGVLVETFDKADGVGWNFNLTWSPISGAGTQHPGTDTGEGVVDGGNILALMMADLPLSGLDQYAQVEVTTFDPAGGIQLHLRGLGDVPGLRVVYDVGTEDWILRDPSGTISGPTPAGIVAAAGDVIRAEVEFIPGVGTEVRGYVNGVLDFTVSGLTGVQHGYKAGVGIFIGNPPLGDIRIDNFEAGTL